MALLLLVWPASATATAPALTLKGPKATIYLHGVDFAGHLSPAVPDARVRLMRGSTIVSTTRVRPDGSFLFKVELAKRTIVRTLETVAR